MDLVCFLVLGIVFLSLWLLNLTVLVSLARRFWRRREKPPEKPEKGESPRLYYFDGRAFPRPYEPPKSDPPV